MDYGAALAGVIVDLSLSSNQARSVGSSDAAGIDIDQLINIEAVGGSNFDDFLTGNGERNSLLGRGGDDTIYGGDGNDNLNGGAGNDLLDGGAEMTPVIFTDPWLASTYRS